VVNALVKFLETETTRFIVALELPRNALLISV
jgi:hypothetical protein